MQENRAFIDHRYDVWHVRKNIKTKLEKLAKEKQCQEIAGWIQSIINHLYWSASSTDDGDGDVIRAKWVSVLNHVQNKHTNHGPLFPNCSHGQLLPAVMRKKKWIKADSIPALKLETVVARTALLRDVRKLLHHYQTYGLEVFHSLVNQFAPKRLLLATLHFNEDSDREQARTSAGDLVFSLKFPKAKRGGDVVRSRKGDPTYDYIEKLVTEVERLSIVNICIEISHIIHIPPHLSSSFEKPDKDEVNQLVSRFRKWDFVVV